jgi:hypothetical protein
MIFNRNRLVGLLLWGGLLLGTLSVSNLSGDYGDSLSGCWG